MFRDILKGLKKGAEKVIEEVDELAKEQSEKGDEEDSYSNVPVGRYGRLNAWIKSNYGNRFKDTSTTDEVKEQLEQILRERERMGDFRDYPDILKGFQAYIRSKQYGDLVRSGE